MVASKIGKAVPGWLALTPALWWVGSGPLNGDAAAYAAQAASGDWTDRFTHAAYVVAFAPLGWFGVSAVNVAMDLVTLGAAAALVALVVARTGLPAAGVAAAAVVLPFAASGEVDLPWMALAAGAVVWPGCIAMAVALSPSALVVVPFVAAVTRRWNVIGLALAAILLLTLVSLGDWWVGERGVLRGPPLDPLRTLRTLLTTLAWPLALVALSGTTRTAWPILGMVFLLALPADLPVAVPLGLVLAVAASHSPWRRMFVAATALQLAIGFGGLWARGQRVRSEAAIVAHVVQSLGPEDGLVAPFTWGSRVAVAMTGDPYGIRWRPPTGFLRDQASAWCTDTPARSFVLPAGTWVSGDTTRSECP